MANGLPGARHSGIDWRLLLRALRHRNYRLFFGGQGISLIGTWMTRVATGWLVYRLTGSAFLLGLVSFAGQIPILFLGPFAGVWVDRWNRHRVLIITQILSMIESFALAGLALAGIITVAEVILLNLFQGAVNAFDMPARQAFLVEMVEDHGDLGNAIALNSSLVNAARLIGPSIAGLIIAVVGEGYCFLIDGISYIAVIISLFAMMVEVHEHARKHESVLSELREGWDYVRGFKPIWSILLLLALISLVGMPYTALMPIFAGRILHGGAHTLGFLMGAVGVGALIGAFRLAARRSVLGLGRLLPITAAGFGASLIAFAASRQQWLSLLLLVVTGYCFMQQMASSNTILQTIVENEKRGRVMSFYAMSFQGVAPFGSLIAGAAASRIGSPYTLMIGGALCVLGAALFAIQLPALRQLIRPIYIQIGILPELRTGINTASVLQEPPEE
ncbi:MAG TPA: MFS transporter [Candidatus Sulfotelmatobacter sp.]|nr:MFS transporter [Candidatus Sulfotelmatobacter sp.]